MSVYICISVSGLINDPWILPLVNHFISKPAIILDLHTLKVVKIFTLPSFAIYGCLTWQSHMDNVTAASTYRFCFLRTLKLQGFPTYNLTTVYYLFILPKLTYASSSLTTTQRDQLEKVQKRDCKIILEPFYTTYEEALNVHGLHPLFIYH